MTVSGSLCLVSRHPQRIGLVLLNTITFPSRATQVRLPFSWLPHFGVLAAPGGNVLMKVKTRSLKTGSEMLCVWGTSGMLGQGFPTDGAPHRSGREGQRDQAPLANGHRRPPPQLGMWAANLSGRASLAGGT